MATQTTAAHNSHAFRAGGANGISTCTVCGIADGTVQIAQRCAGKRAYACGSPVWTAGQPMRCEFATTDYAAFVTHTHA